MARKRKITTPCLNDTWVYSTEIEINGRKVVQGTELKIKGERGRFLFHHHVDTGEATWVDVFSKTGAHRFFYPERIQVVHVKNKTDTNLAKLHKAKKVAAKA
ncbi:hypothetical protein UFOVP111_119 [uncultured Caudovirales phage]|uniref:DUF7246 domain-containing protein n=1 Tax=uncultured Caudovirales phage TaxID=2100421 RepID=A0A6J5LB00_9CAUD|nr:hypothetical protein UFOVP111_119 [uncultured Caudovirales phage]